MLIQGIHHVALRYAGEEKWEEAIGFYRDLLGLEVARVWGEGDASAAMIDTGGGILEIFANGAELPAGGMIAHVALSTREVDRCVEAVRRAGYAVTVPPKDILLPTQPPYPARIAFCRGPGGEEVEFFQAL